MTDNLLLHATQATHCYLNPDIPEYNTTIDEYRTRFAAIHELEIMTNTYSDISLEMQRNRFPLDRLLAQNLHHYLDVDFTCQGTILRVFPDRKWFYRACNRCTKKSTKVEGNPGKFVCPSHGRQRGCRYMYRFNTLITDGTIPARFTFLSTSGESVVGYTAEELVTIHGHDDPHLMPPQITAIEGQTHCLQFHFDPLSPANFQEFVVDKVLDENPLSTGSATPRTITAAASTSRPLEAGEPSGEQEGSPGSPAGKRPRH